MAQSKASRRAGPSIPQRSAGAEPAPDCLRGIGKDGSQSRHRGGNAGDGQRQVHGGRGGSESHGRGIRGGIAIPSPCCPHPRGKGQVGDASAGAAGSNRQLCQYHAEGHSVPGLVPRPCQACSILGDCPTTTPAVGCLGGSSTVPAVPNAPRHAGCRWPDSSKPSARWHRNLAAQQPGRELQMGPHLAMATQGWHAMWCQSTPPLLGEARCLLQLAAASLCCVREGPGELCHGVGRGLHQGLCALPQGVPGAGGLGLEVRRSFLTLREGPLFSVLRNRTLGHLELAWPGQGCVAQSHQHVQHLALVPCLAQLGARVCFSMELSTPPPASFSWSCRCSGSWESPGALEENPGIPMDMRSSLLLQAGQRAQASRLPLPAPWGLSALCRALAGIAGGQPGCRVALNAAARVAGSKRQPRHWVQPPCHSPLASSCFLLR